MPFSQARRLLIFFRASSVFQQVLAIALALVADPGPPSADTRWPSMAVPPSTGMPLSAESEYFTKNWQWHAGDLQAVPPAAQQVPQQSANFAEPGALNEAEYEDTLAYYDPFTRQLAFGNAGYQPYRLGWYFYDEVPWMPTSPVRGTTGSFQDVQYNAWARYSRRLGERHFWAWTGAWNSSFWTGPSGVNLPGGAEQFVSDIQVSSLYAGRWNWQAGVTPQVNADFRRTLDHNAYMVDGRFALFYQASPEVRLAAGMEYWNRVHGIIIPYGGVIWSPDDRWEFRFFFPQSRISRYYGNVWGHDVWAYATAGYQVQAWQVTLQDQIPAKTRMQMSDVQFMLGIAAAAGKWTAFVEGGLITDRHVQFRAFAPPFTIHDTLMLRIGALY